MSLKEKDKNNEKNESEGKTPGNTSGLQDDKYLAMEQPGVTYTKDTNPTANSDQFNYLDNNNNEEWSEEGGNTKNSDAFNQDEDLLEDNIDLDEDQSQSISSDDEDFEESNERYTN